MKDWRFSILSLIGILGLGIMFTFNSCEKDPCSDLNCHDGSCSEGLCHCPLGWEGPECDIPAADRFIGSYSGHLKCDNFPVQTGDVTISLLAQPDSIKMVFPFGNTYLSTQGIARTPEAIMQTYDDANVRVQPYVTVDGNLLYVYLETIDHTTNVRQVCRFSGTRN